MDTVAPACLTYMAAMKRQRAEMGFGEHQARMVTPMAFAHSQGSLGLGAVFLAPSSSTGDGKNLLKRQLYPDLQAAFPSSHITRPSPLINAQGWLGEGISHFNLIGKIIHVLIMKYDKQNITSKYTTHYVASL